MNNADYMVEQMIKHQNKWIAAVDNYGRTVIIIWYAKIYGVEESDGTIVSVETLVNMYNQRKTES